MLTFTTRAPASTAATIPAARSALVMEPEAVTRTGMIGVAPATPRPPMPFPSIALTRPAMNVPWPRVSCVDPAPRMSRPAVTRPTRSGWSRSTPELTTATGLDGAPPPAAASASPARTAPHAHPNARPVAGSRASEGSACRDRGRSRST